MFDLGFWLSAGFFFSFGLFTGVWCEHRAREYFTEKEKKKEHERENRHMQK